MPSCIPPETSTGYTDGVMTVYQRKEMSQTMWQANQKTRLVPQWWNIKAKGGRAYNVKPIQPWWCDLLIESTLKWKEGPQPRVILRQRMSPEPEHNKG